MLTGSVRDVDIPSADDNWYPIRTRIRWDVDYAQSMIMYGITYENAKELDELAYHYTTNTLEQTKSRED